MSLFFASLNSGSNGNCYYIGNHEDAVLVDVGISCNEVEKRMCRLKLPLQRVKAIFISHEHTDHIKGVKAFAEKHQIPVFISPGTLSVSRLRLQKSLTENLKEDQRIKIGSLIVHPFIKYHDAAEPYSFIITNNYLTIGVFTDIGRVCSNLEKYMKQCDAVFLEANYDEAMLENGNYPTYLKQRIKGGSGHLSNRQALDLLIKNRSPTLKFIILSHLSKNNNCPFLAKDLFDKHLPDTINIVASRYEETPVFELNDASKNVRQPKPSGNKRPLQLQLFVE